MPLPCTHILKTTDGIGGPTVTHMGEITVVKVGQLQGFFTPVRGTATFTVNEGDSGGTRHCAKPDPGFDTVFPTMTKCSVGTDLSTGLCSAPGFAKVIEAAFVANGPFLLTVSNLGAPSPSISSAPAGISCPSDCDESYAKDTAVILTATPGAGFEFVNWTVDDAFNGPLPSPANNPLTVTMDRNWSLTANYIESITVIGNGRARALSSTDVVVVEAIPAPNNYLVGVSCPP